MSVLTRKWNFPVDKLVVVDARTPGAGCPVCISNHLIQTILVRLVPESTGDVIEFGFAQSTIVFAHSDVLSNLPRYT